MTDMRKALDDIDEIRSRIAAQTEFRGFGPVSLAATAGLAVVTASVQTMLPGLGGTFAFVALWAGTAVIAAGLLAVEMLRRTRQQHDGIADEMLQMAVQQFFPVVMAGAGLALYMLVFAPQLVWMLPGLWQILIAVGLLGALRLLPRNVVHAGGWYFLSGFTVLMLGSIEGTSNPWTMGIPFAVGQVLLAWAVHRASRASDD